MITTVIFDMDGLMFDTERLSTDAWIQIGLRHGYPIDTELMTLMKGRPLPDCIRLFQERFGEDFNYYAMRGERDAFFREAIEKNGMPVKPGLYELLKFLRQKKIRTAVATSTNRMQAMNYFKLAEVDTYFDAMIFGDEVQHGKPEPDIFLRAMKELNAAPDETLILEDSPIGIEAGYRSGASVIMIPDTILPGEMEYARIKACLDNLSDVIPWLSAKNAERFTED